VGRFFKSPGISLEVIRGLLSMLGSAFIKTWMDR
jgi:hypothetical protein